MGNQEYKKSRKTNENPGCFQGSFLLLIKKIHSLHLRQAETPLILLNKPKVILKTSMLITNKNVYYKVLKRSFWTSITQIFVRPQIQSMSLDKIKHFQIGEHDSCYGTEYVGHSLEINQETAGLLRMGTGITMNEEIIVYINSLSEYLVDKGAFQIKPKKYAWQ